MASAQTIICQAQNVCAGALAHVLPARALPQERRAVHILPLRELVKDLIDRCLHGRPHGSTAWALLQALICLAASHMQLATAAADGGMCSAAIEFATAACRLLGLAPWLAYCWSDGLPKR